MSVHRVVRIVTVLAFALVLPAQVQTFTSPAGAWPLTSGGPALCSQGSIARLAADVPTGFGWASKVSIGLYPQVQDYGSVLVTVINPTGLRVVALIPACMGSAGDPSWIDGLYTLDDDAAETFDEAALARPGTGWVNRVPNGRYRPDLPLLDLVQGGPAGGRWIVEMQLIGYSPSLDPGRLYQVMVELTPGVAPPSGPRRYEVRQDRPGGPIFFVHLGGTPGGVYVNPVALGPNRTPNGWFFGLEIPWLDLATEIMTGPSIFTGWFNASGAYVSPPLPVAPGTVFGTVGLHFAPLTGTLEYSSPAFTFTVQ